RALNALELLDGLAPVEIHRLAALAEPFELEAGEHLFREGDLDGRPYVVASGSVAYGGGTAGPGEGGGEMGRPARGPRAGSARWPPSRACRGRRRRLRPSAPAAGGSRRPRWAISPVPRERSRWGRASGCSLSRGCVPATPCCRSSSTTTSACSSPCGPPRST